MCDVLTRTFGRYHVQGPDVVKAYRMKIGQSLVYVNQLLRPILASLDELMPGIFLASFGLVMNQRFDFEPFTLFLVNCLRSNYHKIV
jgi:hypothetical protein